MARYPDARWRPVTRYIPGGSSNQPMTRYDGGIDHTYVGSPSHDRAFAGFNTPGTPTPHFMFFLDGSVVQYIDTAFRSSACLDGNHRLVTWETQDGFPDLWSNGQAPKDNPKVVQAKAKFIVWLNKTHGIPLTRMPSSLPTARGFGWHRLGIDGNFEQKAGELLGGRVAGGEHWSTSFGKTCPTSRRIHQFVEETLPAAVVLATPKPTPPTKPTPKVRIVHASGRFDATDVDLAAALDAYAADADVITLTEVAGIKLVAALVAWAADNNWHLYHPSAAGQRECAILSRTPFTTTKAQRLTDLTLKVGRTSPLFLISAHVKGGPWVAVWHSPAHNEGLKRGLWPTRVYRSALAGLRVARMRLRGGGVAACGDWNLDLDRASVRAQLAKPFPRFKWAWARGQKPTLGGRVIDGVLTNLEVAEPATTLPAQPGFDHRAVAVVLKKRSK